MLEKLRSSAPVERGLLLVTTAPAICSVPQDPWTVDCRGVEAPMVTLVAFVIVATASGGLVDPQQDADGDGM